MARRTDDFDAWYEAEEPWGRALVVELQRLKRRATARPILTLLLAVLMTGLVIVKVARKPQASTAHIVMAVSEGSLSTGRDPMPVHELQQHVINTLLPDADLAALIQEKNLFPLRAKLGMPFAIGELRDLFEVTVYRNYFLQDGYSPDLRRTARIELAVTHADATQAFELAHRLASIIVDNSDELEGAAAAALQQSADAVIARARADVALVERTASQKQLDLHLAEQSQDPAVRATLPGLRNEFRSITAELLYQQHRLTILQANTLVDQQTAGAMAAGLSLKLEVVAERRPPVDVGADARLRILAVIAFVILLPVAGILIGAFDARIHDAGDITRLGFISLGHLPGFQGDRIGSLRARGVRRRRAAQY